MPNLLADVSRKALNPRFWGRSVSCWIVWSTMAGAVIGGSAAWWFGLAWIDFEQMQAYYIDGDPAIYVSGHYQVNSPCDPARVVWRVEALATDGQIALYGPQPLLPEMARGEHVYKERLPLLEEISPDGWEVTVLATCTDEGGQQTIASDPARVMMINPDAPRGGGL